MNTNAAPNTQAQPAAINNGLEVAWQIYALNLNSGATSCIEMPFQFKYNFGAQGLETIASRFRDLIQAPVTTIEDPQRNVIQIVPSCHVHGHNSIISGAGDPKVKTAKKDKVTRPPNAFILYRKHHHPLVKAAQPGIHNNEISIHLGEKWRNEPQSTREHFRDMADELKAKHQREHPEYQYQPRKPSEKKRRMTQRKKAALTAKSHSKASPSTKSPVVVLDDPIDAIKISATVPNLPETPAGNAMLAIGGDELDDETLTAMLEQYNSSRPQSNNQVAAIITQSSPPVLYGEPTEDAQQEKNFYSELHDCNTFESNNDLSEDVGAVYDADEYAALSLQQLAEFDREHERLFDAELNRMCHWNRETFFYQG